MPAVEELREVEKNHVSIGSGDCCVLDGWLPGE